jgi:uncharacterized protein YdgA (DUF945 family)
MKKTILITLIIVALTVLIGPFAVGVAVEKKLQNEVARFNGLPGYQAKVTSHNFGWLSSQAQIEIGLDEQLFMTSDLTDQQKQEIANQFKAIVFDVDMYHGPIIVRDGNRFGWVESTATLNLENSIKAKHLIAQTGVESFLVVDQTSNLLGQSEFVVSSPSFTLSEIGEQQAQLIFNGFEMHGSFNLFNNRVIYSGLMPVSQLVVDENRIEFGPMKLSADVEYLTPDIPLGDFEMIFDHMSVLKNDAPSTLFAMNNLKFGYNVVEDGNETLKVTIFYGVDDITIEDASIKNVDFKVSVEHLGVSVIKEYMDMLKYHMELGGRVDQLPQEKLTALGESFLKNSPMIVIENAGFTIDGEALRGSVTIKMDGSDSETLKNPLLMMSAIEVEADIQFSEKIAILLGGDKIATQLRSTPQGGLMSEAELQLAAESQIRSLLAMQARQGSLVKSLNNYQASFTMKGGKMELNGSPFPLIQ